MKGNYNYTLSIYRELQLRLLTDSYKHHMLQGKIKQQHVLNHILYHSKIM